MLFSDLDFHSGLIPASQGWENDALLERYFLCGEGRFVNDRVWDVVHGSTLWDVE
jgi:hypothetical protein